MSPAIRKYGWAVAAMASLWTLSACGGHKQARVNVPPPPAISAPQTETAKIPAADSTSPSRPSSKTRTAKSVPKPGVENHKVENNPEESDAGTPSADLAEPQIPEGTAVLSTETGLASWYGPPYHNRRGSNGEVYNMHAMTAAHRTLPLGSVVRVTNTRNGQSVLVRITDRGPFIPGRVIDLSLAAARKIEVWRAGVAPVKLEVLATPAPLEVGGKWAVQIGGFPDQDRAATLAGHLTRRYRSAKVLSFASPAGDWWIRVRVLDDDHARAQQLASETQTTEGAVFLVRLD
jgi:rare lipoprotein A